MPPRVRKRKTCSCCEVPSPPLTSEPENATKRRRVGKISLSTTEPIIGNVVEQPPVNQSSQLVPSKVFAPEVEESNENIVFESAGHSTRRMKNRRCQTIRGREFVHTFTKEVTYTVATTRLGYVGQELLPFQKRHIFFQKSSSAVPKVDDYVTLSEKSDCGSDDVKNFTKAFGDDIDCDSDSSFVDNDGDSVWSFKMSSADDDEFKDSDSHFDVDSDSDSVGSFKKSSADDDEFKDSDSHFDVDSDSDSVGSLEKSSADDDEFKDSYSSFDDDNDGYSVGSLEKSSDDDDDSIDNDSLPDLGSNAGSAKKFEKPTVDDNDSVHSESSESDDDWACFSKFGFRCQWHNKTRNYCWCRRWPCDYDSRPEPAPCPKELETLEEVLQSRSNEKKEYAILKEVNLGYEDCSPCVYLYSNELLTICNRQHSSLRIDRTFNLGHCYVTMFAFRNGNLIDNSKKSEYGPVMTGPVMIHFDKSLSTYQRFFNTIRESCGIANEPMTSGAISDMRHVPKKDHVITKAMRLSFGTNMSLCSNHIVPISLRTSLKRGVSCYSPVVEVVKVVHTKMFVERYETRRAIYGVRSGWRLTERAKRYMEQWALQSHTVQLDALDKLSPEY